VAGSGNCVIRYGPNELEKCGTLRAFAALAPMSGLVNRSTNGGFWEEMLTLVGLTSTKTRGE
tara:strand:- start:128 stop:313 length:186 start_codon:yes stop_codon:yes gene_type:complete